MKKLSFSDVMMAAMSRDARFDRTRNADEELARILGGIGALPEPLPLSNRVEALREIATVDRMP